jgi:hypothetical protein
MLEAASSQAHYDQPHEYKCTNAFMYSALTWPRTRHSAHEALERGRAQARGAESANMGQLNA